MTNQGLFIKIKENITVPALSPNDLQCSYYLPNGISFISFNDLQKKEALEVLRWRNHTNIRSCMYQQTIISKETHFKFLSTLSKQTKKFYWVVKEGNTALGVIDIVDYRGKESEWGFYLNPDHFGKGLSINLLFHALNFFFKTLKFSGLFGYCHYKNTKALLFHDLFEIHHQGYQQIEADENNDWYSHRTITAQKWLRQQVSIKDIKARTKENKHLIIMETKKIKLDQIFIEVFEQAPHSFYRTKQPVSNLQKEPTLFVHLIDRIEQDFSRKISSLEAAETLYYMDALKLCF